jgi:hypothetical protein
MILMCGCVKKNKIYIDFYEGPVKVARRKINK